MTATTVAIEDTLDWNVFADRYWDKAPVLFRDVGAPPFVTDEVLAAAVAACAPGPGDTIPAVAQLMTGNRRLLTAAGRVPVASDTDFDGYAKRVGAALDGGKHSLVVPGLHGYDADMWTRERVFYRPLWQRVGISMTTAITTLFHGNYEHSPVGVHKDRFGTFMYVLSGRKRMRMWPHRPWDHDASTIVDYARYLDSSFTAEAEAGQLLYWPATYYHVGENLGDDPATSVNVGVPREGRRTQYEIADLIATVPATDLTDPDGYLTRRLPAIDTAPFTDPGDTSGELPAALAQGLDAAVGLLADIWTDERRATVTLNRYTAGGFQPVPDPASRPELSDSSRLRRARHADILWFALNETSALCSGNGHTATARPAPGAAAALLGRLDAGPATVAELLNAVNADQRNQCRELLTELCAFRAVEVAG